ncbi:FecCD family ABC transporter permease [Photobacterium leiognathi]|uniref:FecCD family ABC transporter permease n=1 Tax=Photobacterium leiognathi TaxID=553611 RepID=UPI000D16389F|nr:iron ABC transporter permease [Photobacterium leiognathi]PSW42710.1 iron ABC transporter permease [Photobacterium leiognathi subsp. mandapamensis]
MKSATLSVDENHQTTSLSQCYRRFVIKRILLLSMMAIALVIAWVIDTTTGPSQIGLNHIFSALFQPEVLDPVQQVIIFDVRIPYALMAIVVGAALGLAGAEMQTSLNNPLASPFTLGIGAAATLGAAVAILFDWSWLPFRFDYILPLFAFVFALLASLLVVVLSRSQGASINTVILFGISLFFALNALVSLLMFVADSNALQQIVFWTMGSLVRANNEKVLIVALVFAVCFPLSMRQAWAMTAIRSGEDQARSIGIRVERMRLMVLLRVSLLTAVAVAFVGEIGFVGLVGPHITRMLLGEDHRFFLPGSAIAGALLLSLASIASKSLIPGVILPIGIVTSLIGIPFFMSLILSSKGKL